MSHDDASDFVTLADAAAYIGVSKDTLRRWDSSGKLKPVRRPGSGYRFYARSALEPFRLEYRRAEQAAEQTNLFVSPNRARIRRCVRTLRVQTSPSLYKFRSAAEKLASLPLFRSELPEDALSSSRPT